MHSELAERVAQLVEAACRSEQNRFGYGIWSHHIRQVRQFGCQLAGELGANREVVELAALLHDYAGICDVALEPEHHRHGAELARLLLGDLGCAPGVIEQVATCILVHRASQPATRSSLEAVCLASADGMAHIDQVPSLLCYVYRQEQMAIDQGQDWVRDKLKRSYGKLCPEAQAMVREKYQAALLVLA